MADGSLLVSPEAMERIGGRRELRSLLAADRHSPTFSGPTERPASVRIAGPKDEQACLDLLLLDLAANAAHIAVVDEIKVMEQIRIGTRGRGGFTGVIDGPDGKPVAITILVSCQWWWSQGWFLQEVVNFVHPEHRNSRHADDLLNFAKSISDDMSKGMGTNVWLLCGVLGAWRVQSKLALYRRKFVQAGGAFLYPAPPIKEG